MMILVNDGEREAADSWAAVGDACDRKWEEEEEADEMRRANRDARIWKGRATESDDANDGRNGDERKARRRETMSSDCCERPRLRHHWRRQRRRLDRRASFVDLIERRRCCWGKS